MFYQLQSCTNLENLISKKEKVTSMAKNLSVTTSISDFDNYLSDLHGSCGSFRTKLYVSFFCCILFSYKFGILWPNLTQQSMDYNNLDCVNPEEEDVASSNDEDREDVEWREIEIVTNIMMMLICDLPLAACHDQF